MNIHQLSVRYQFEQDRILLSLNTTEGHEIELWLTRRMTLAMWPQLNRMTIDQFAVPADAKSDGYVDLTALDERTRAALTDFRRQELLQNMDFKTPYRSENKVRPLGEGPLLVTEITLSPAIPGSIKIHFQEKIGPDTAHRGIALDLQAQLVFSLIQLLNQTLQHTQWQSNGVSSAPTPSDSALVTPTDRPTYLN
jgi:hypothetical protein